MSLCKSIFQKTIRELEKKDLEDYFSSDQEETSVLEFKSGRVELEDIHRQISAFLNTEGGLLIIGAPEEVPKYTGSKTKVCKGNLTASSIISADTILRSISSNIIPTPSGIKVNSFPHLNGTVYILEIPQSIAPPHQVSNEGRYYIRLEREAKPAPHGLIEALFQKRQRPELNSSLDVSNKHSSESVFIKFNLNNTSVISAEKIGYLITIYGVKQVNYFKNIVGDYSLKQDTLIANGLFPDNILIKGLELSMELEMTPVFDFFLISFSHYCLSSPLEIKLCVFDFNDFSFDFSFDSKRIDNLHSMDEVIEYYKNRRSDKIKDLIINSVFTESRTRAPVSIDLLNIDQLKLKTELPDDYWELLRIANGFTCVKNGKHFELYQIENVCDNDFYFHQERLLMIGQSDLEYYVIKFEDDEFVYGVVPKNQIQKDRFVLLGNSITDILKDINSLS